MQGRNMSTIESMSPNKPARKKALIWVALLFAAIIALGGSLYLLVVPGLSSARDEPPAVEVSVETWLLHRSVPDEARRSVNPLGADPADITAGRDLYREKCEVCHAYDGGGKTTIGAGEYPRPPALRSAAIAATPDGELFYHIRNGIRNTGMPAWNLPDRQIWQLVSYIRHLPQVAAMTADPVAALSAASEVQQHYVGSAACKSCHESISAPW